MGEIGATWAGTHHFASRGLIEPTSIAEVQDAVRRAGRVRALGTRHSFHDLADTDGTLITVTGVDPAPSSTGRTRLGPWRATVTVGAGIRYGDLALWLEERGWALHNLGSLPHISVGGATATGTHGSGDELGNLATAVRGIEYVGADGDLHRVSAGTRTSTGTSCTRRLRDRHPADARGRADVPGAAGRLLGRPLGCPARRPRRGHGLRVQRQRLRALDRRWVAVIRKTRLGTGREPDLPDAWRGGSRLARR